LIANVARVAYITILALPPDITPGHKKIHAELMHMHSSSFVNYEKVYQLAQLFS